VSEHEDDLAADEAPPARLMYTAAQHAMFAESLLMSGLRGNRYRSRADQDRAAAVHAQLAQTLLMASDLAERRFDMEAAEHEWAHALAVRSPAADVDAELVNLTEGES
jgi:hypothetical protein